MQTSPKRPSTIELRKLVGSVNQLRFNDNRGEVSFFGQKMIILRRDVFHVMREGLERLVGEQAAPFLSYLASGVGVHEGSIFRDSVKATGGNERAGLENLVHTAFEDTNLGLGKIKVNEVDFDQSIANVVISNCFEAMENGSSEHPNCMFTSGFLAGLFAEMFDKTVQADEVKCISQGATECEFQIVPAEQPASPETGQTEAPSKPTQSPSIKDSSDSKDKKPAGETKPVNVEPGLTAGGKDEAGTGARTQRDFDAGVERASRIAKRKQHFWERIFKD